MDKEVRLSIGGMDCADCAPTIETGLAMVPGVRESHVDYDAATCRARYDADRVTEQKIVGTIQLMGFTARVLP